MCTILSNLPAKEAVRSSVLSSEWRSIWTTCPKLSFNAKDHVPRHGGKQYAQMFIDHVNAVLKKHHGKVVDNLEIKFVFESKLVYHLNSWIRFAMSSRTKNLSFDLAPLPEFWKYRNHYRFPFELLDMDSVSCLRCLQLRFVCFKPPPSQFPGFPNLRNIVRCDLDDELKVVQRPLSNLQYLRVKFCGFTKIEFHAAKLSTFVYKGDCIPIAFHQAPEMENAEICFCASTFRRGSAVVLNGLPHVPNLTLKISVEVLETTWTSDSHYMFPQLKHLQIILAVDHKHDDKILYLVPLLRAAPFIEHLEVHVSIFLSDHLCRQDIPQSEHKYLHLKKMHVTGFKATKGQLQLLFHVVENAPAIETLAVDTIQRQYDLLDTYEILPALRNSALDIVRDPLSKRLPPDAKLYLL
ncbi:hypothetical protein CFC21_105255 [Triticum aestivum]|uniref:FBD domain-containing protein n=2 Tax=Triticum aestivum TaxID=4565 RepID=A0A3B6SN89_WHEAT|nr:hypothetical protein CFC21_105255 [Triticum aestivum]